MSRVWKSQSEEAGIDIYESRKVGGWDARAGGSRGSRMRRGCCLVPGPVRPAGFWGSCFGNSARLGVWGLFRPASGDLGRMGVGCVVFVTLLFVVLRRAWEHSLGCLLCRSRISVASASVSIGM